MKVKSFIKDVFEVIITSAVIVFVLLNWVLLPVEVHGTSMVPTLVEGQRGFSFKITKQIGLERFDIVVIDKTDENDKLLVKRIIGMPNETIKYQDNVLYINGVQTNQDFLKEDVITNDFEITLADDEYFCLGDNREVSKDSRYYGPFSKEEIVSSKLFVFSPIKDFGIK